MREFLSVAGIVAAMLFAVIVLFIPMAYLDSKGCERTGQIQGVETVYHWTTSCVYVNPDYVVTK